MKKFGQDLHGNNWMIRLTAHGPQLVIIDPFSAVVFDEEDEFDNFDMYDDY